jgi:hypothetical protein
LPANIRIPFILPDIIIILLWKPGGAKSVKHAVNHIQVRCLQHEPWETFSIEFMIMGSLHVERWA